MILSVKAMITWYKTLGQEFNITEDIFEFDAQ